ncbi:MAG: DUF916 domain-containing protein [Patescibacteria group bacterium]
MNLRDAKKNFLMKILPLIAVAFWVALPSSCAYAVDSDGITAYPTTADPNNPLPQSSFIYNLKPGESKEDYLTVKNESEQEQSVSIYAVDAVANAVGESVLENEIDTRDNMGRWINLETVRLVLKPKEDRRIKFEIDIPEDAVGKVFGGIIIQKDPTAKQKNTKSEVVANARIDIRVYETVPEEIIYKAGISGGAASYDKKDGSYTYSVKAKNEGNASLDSTVRINVRDMLFGKQNQTIERKILIPRGEEMEVSAPLNRVGIGKFEVSSEIEYRKADGTQEKIANPNRISFSAFPQEFIPIIGLLFLADIILIVISRLKKRKDKKYYKDYRIQPGDNLENLAERLSVNWKKIAKINKMKPPYQLEEGQIITVIDKENALPDFFPKDGAFIKPTDDQVRQDREEAFEKDLALISDEEESSTTDGKPRGSNKILKTVTFAIAFALLGYFIYTQFFTKGNNANFIYDRNRDKLADTTTTPDTGKETATAEEKTAPVPTADSTSTIKEDPAKEISVADRQAAKIKILNGSGVRGASSKALALFRKKGYTSITTSNATRFDYNDTVIECGSNVKPAICQEAEEIVTSLLYASIQRKEIGGADADRVIITLGK